MPGSFVLATGHAVLAVRSHLFTSGVTIERRSQPRHDDDPANHIGVHNANIP